MVEGRVMKWVFFISDLHLHYPQREEENGKVYLNTGDWMTHFSYGYFDGKELQLKHWEEQISSK